MARMKEESINCQFKKNSALFLTNINLNFSKNTTYVIMHNKLRYFNTRCKFYIV